MPRTKVEFEVRVYSPNSHFKKEGISSLEEAHKLIQHSHQCTWEETQETPTGYSHIMEFRNDEFHNELYFI